MSAERLRAMLSKATPGPWRVDERYVMALKEKWVAELPCGGVLHAKVDARNARLIALAPDAIALLADAEEALIPARDLLMVEVEESGDGGFRAVVEVIDDVLARLDALTRSEGVTDAGATSPRTLP